MKIGRIFLLAILMGVLTPAWAGQANSGKVIRLAATTSIDNSGLLTYLLPQFTSVHGYTFDLKIVGSGKALRLGRTGDVDMVWVHSPAAEKKFIEEGLGINHQTIMRNDFVIAGPVDDPGKIVFAADVFETLRIINRQQLMFVSRADDSGTHKKELALWKNTQIDPYGQHWYLESGTGMAATLKIAQQANAYLMIDRATFLVRGNQKLKILKEDPVNLANPYSVIAINPAKQNNINLTGAKEFISWLISNKGQQAIAAYQHQGMQLYTPTVKTRP
jgi:tungstate transport system substrate-binding protein